MACSSYAGLSDLTSAWVDGAFFDAVYCAFVLQLGEVVTGLLVLAPIALAMHTYYDSEAPLLVLFVIVGGALAAQLPHPALRIGVIALIIGGTAAGWYVVRRAHRTL